MKYLISAYKTKGAAENAIIRLIKQGYIKVSENAKVEASNIVPDYKYVIFGYTD